MVPDNGTGFRYPYGHNEGLLSLMFETRLTRCSLVLGGYLQLFFLVFKLVFSYDDNKHSGRYCVLIVRID
jgi:hypothetical protein